MDKAVSTSPCIICRVSQGGKELVTVFGTPDVICIRPSLEDRVHPDHVVFAMRAHTENFTDTSGHLELFKKAMWYAALGDKLWYEGDPYRRSTVSADTGVGEHFLVHLYPHH